MFILIKRLFSRLPELFFSSFFVIILQSCSNTPIGQDLSQSFDSPAQSDDSQEKPINRNNNLIQNKPSKVVQINPNIRANSKIKELRNEKKNSNYNPQPYRITIKLSAANPSAPAERVTKALRTAGLAFEVEKIEIITEQFSSKKSQVQKFRR